MFTINDALLKLRNQNSLFFKKECAAIKMTGPDCEDFLQRMSTNDITSFNDNPFYTAFTDNKGRIIDLCLVKKKKKDDIVLLSSKTDANILNTWLERFHFIEDFSIDNITLSLYYIINSEYYPSNSFKSCLSSSDTFYINSMFTVPSDSIEISSDLFETLRIIAKMPKFPNEINESVMPQNCNLEEIIAPNKGCYIGQEVIAKAITYQKHKKTLQGLRLDEETWLNWQNIKPGHVTSVAPIYVPEEFNALTINTLD